MFKHKFGENNLKTSEDLKKVKIGSSAKERAAEVWSTDEQDALHVSILDSDLKKDKYASSLINPFGVYDGGEVPIVDCPAGNIAADGQLNGCEELLIDDAIDQLVAELVEENGASIEDEAKEDKVEDSTKEGRGSDCDEPRKDILVDELNSDDIPVVHESVSTCHTLELDQKAAHKLVGIYSPSLAYISSVQKELELLGEAWVYCFDGSAGMDSLNSAPQLGTIDTWIINLTDDDECDMLDTILDESADANTMYLSGSVLSKACKTKLREFLVS